MKRTGIVLTFVMLFTLFSAIAQEPGNEAAKQPKLEDKMLAWALLEAEGTPQMMERTLRAILENQMKASPEMLPFRNAFEEYLRETISYEAQKEELAAIYLAVYTKDEIRELIRFYQSPIGRKRAAAGAQISVAAAEMTQRKMQETLPRFQLRMQKTIQEMQEPGESPRIRK